MLNDRINFKNGIAKARMCMAGCVAVSTLTLGFTSRAAAMPEDMVQNAFPVWESVIEARAVLEEGSRASIIKAKAAVHVEAVLEEAEKKAEELAAEREAEQKRAAAEQEAARSQQAAGTAAAAAGGDKELLASIIFCEAGNQSFEGQVAVGAVIMNRIASGAYPNTIEGVVYQPGQFGPAGSGWLDQIRSTAGYTASAMQAAEAALAGQNPIGGCLYFDQGGYGMQIGAHFFH